MAPQTVGKVTLTTLPIQTGDQTIEFQAAASLNPMQSTTQTVSVEQLVELFVDIDDVADPIEVGSETAYQVRVENPGIKNPRPISVSPWIFPPAFNRCQLPAAETIRSKVRPYDWP